jgi:hypothetical protein
MKTQEEIKQLAKEKCTTLYNGFFGYIDGYTQCQEDMADKKYTESQLRDALEEAMSYSKLRQITEYINSLNKQD